MKQSPLALREGLFGCIFQRLLRLVSLDSEVRMSQAVSPGRMRPTRLFTRFYIAATVLIAASAFVAAGYWLPAIHALVTTGKLPDGRGAPTMKAKESAEQHHHDHPGHDHAGHDHPGHDESSSIELSEQARKNIGLQV